MDLCKKPLLETRAARQKKHPHALISQAQLNTVCTMHVYQFFSNQVWVHGSFESLTLQTLDATLQRTPYYYMQFFACIDTLTTGSCSLCSGIPSFIQSRAT